jgi:cytochrome c-type biogenesis protein CcsB
MERISRSFFSMRMMAMCMIIFAVAIGAATILESIYDIQTAKIFIYNALWFEVLLTYLCMNLIANIFRYGMIKREKIAMLTFHLSFIVIIIGAAITRFVSFEGLMMIREGSQTDFIYAHDPHLWLRINDGKVQYTYAEKMYMTEVKPFGIDVNNFSIPVEFPNHKTPIKIEYLGFRNNLVDTLVVNDSINGMVLEIMTNGMQPNHVGPGGFLMIGDVALSFEKKNEMPGIHVERQGAKIMMKSKVPLRYLAMSEMQKYRQLGTEVPDSLFQEVPTDSLVPFMTTTLYQVGQEQFVFKQVVNHAKRMLLPTGRKDVGSDYLTIKVTDGNESKIIELEGGMNAIPEHEVFTLNGLTYEMEFGSTKIELPFAIACRDFQLDRYPGSNAPSSFASEVTIIDEKNNYKRNQRIFMNNVMDYQGYRFFQSAYDPDEKGTRLSVNHDWWGTNVTYVGYLLMAIGMILSLFAPFGRFRELNGLLNKSKEKREKLLGIFLVGLLSLSTSVFAQDHQHIDGDGHDHSQEHFEGDGHDHSQHSAPSTQVKSKPVHTVMSAEHSKELSSLLVQDFDGRIVPFHTVSDQILRKVYRGIEFEGNNPVQVVMSMHMYPEYWLDQKIISVPSNLREKFKVEEYASFRELGNEVGDFKWMDDYRKAHQKLESQRNEFDKKLIKLVDRFQVLQSVFSWQYMRIIPLKEDANNTWFVPLSSELMRMDSTSSSLALKYISSLDQAAKSGKYGETNDHLKELKKFQREVGAKVVPSETAVSIEISYNKMNIFKNTYRSYLLIGLILLIAYFVHILARPTRLAFNRYNMVKKFLIIPLIIIFAYHGVGLGFRWYISGHAPWSNGYEALIFIAWVTMALGFAVIKKNPVILPGAAILAGLMIFVTEMELMDPEISPLQPVLKSYWLKIHVAIITGSYAFLGLGGILGFMNLILYTFRNNQNGKLVTLNINELTYVSEMIITIGLFMLTIGTFLGGIWANESWGRYWGWDPKETWALVSVLVYAIILHLRYIPALKGKFTFNVVSLWGFSSILFTFFGVNFYLVGLHSYAQGEGLGKFPGWLWILIGGFVAFTLFAWWRKKKYEAIQNS